MFRVWIGCWIIIGGCQQDKHHITLLHCLSRKRSGASKETARVVSGGIESCHLLNDWPKQPGIRLDLREEIRMRGQDNQRIADQARCGLIGLREEANPICENDLLVRAYDLLHLLREKSEEAAA